MPSTAVLKTITYTYLLLPDDEKPQTKANYAYVCATSSASERSMTEESTAVPPAEPETLQRAIETFRVYCGVVLLSFAKHGQGLRETIARNFVARGMTCTQNIFAVWKAGSEQDAWILHRSLLDRSLHLHHLNETNGFSDFEDYSFLSMYKARHQLLSDPDMTSKAPPGMKELQKSNKARYDEIAAKRSRWQRPKPEEVAKKMDLGFLYRFGYDYASTTSIQWPETANATSRLSYRHRMP